MKRCKQKQEKLDALLRLNLLQSAGIVYVMQVIKC